MALMLRDGDYVPDEKGGLRSVDGAEALLQRVLFQLQARRGSVPFLPRLGSRLYLLPREKPGDRAALARQYAVEALREETGLSVTGVRVKELDGGALEVQVMLAWRGESLAVAVEV